MWWVNWIVFIDGVVVGDVVVGVVCGVVVVVVGEVDRLFFECF